MTEYIIDLAAHNASAAMALCDGVREEIVRCRDCKYSYEDRRCVSTGWVDVLACDSKQWSTAILMPMHSVEPDGFCAWGERTKTEQEEL